MKDGTKNLEILVIIVKRRNHKNKIEERKKQQKKKKGRKKTLMQMKGQKIYGENIKIQRDIKKRNQTFLQRNNNRSCTWKGFLLKSPMTKLLIPRLGYRNGFPDGTLAFTKLQEHDLVNQ